MRIIRRADGYYCQFVVAVERNIKTEVTGRAVGIDLGLEKFYTDSLGNSVSNPRYLRKAEKALKRSQRRVSKKFKRPERKGEKIHQSNNYKKACNRLGRRHLKIQRQRVDFARKTASALVQSCDLVAYEDLRVKNMVRNHKLAKSISDVGWQIFLNWVDRYGMLFKRPVIAVPPQYTSQNCSGCGTQVKKSLSVRTHVCPSCKLMMDRDENAARNILEKGLVGAALLTSTAGHAETLNAWGDLTNTLDAQRYSGQVGSRNQESPTIISSPLGAEI